MYYRSPDNQLIWLDSSDFEHLLPLGSLQITEEEAEALRPVPAITVPDNVTMRQARIALLQAGLLDAVNNAIASMQGSSGDAARIEWEFSNEVKRNQPLVLAMKPILGLTDDQLDQLFLTASQL